jgi:hypothetical protein
MADDANKIDPEGLDAHTVREIKRLVESYPVVSEPHSGLNDYRAGKQDAYTTVAAVLSQWLEDTDES